MLEMLILGATGAGLYAVYNQTRNFVRERLRFVDVAQRPSAPWLAGIGATLIAVPVFGGLLAFLPAVGGATALALGVTVGAAVRSGQKEVKLIGGG